ncbi:hypothetical protein CQA49_04930 [Helicobacter sp. MIT 00-7814]|uniref:hypothetical protein n=1 Tax=unclassified Helicobacter TaxID=2593540 RepID=UPI000E1F981D|nr:MULTISPECIES: hypothetical protein [unclassified Helicobacter]RDU54345.1 hypothetical protein CQA37_05420 [Helicobacter sp. MIT 99-10781]RDU54422.1 hypothetical protein CQA49_04930 [Helicobacter sp. MIT 00-7814]
MFGVGVLSLGILAFLSQVLFRHKFARFVFVALFFALSFVPLVEGFNTNALIYSFFGAPSVFCTLLLMIFVLKSFGLTFSFLNHSLKPQTLFVFALFGVLLYLSALNLLPFDLAHLSILVQGVVVLIFIFCIACVDRFALKLLCLSLGLYALALCLESFNLMPPPFDGNIYLFSLYEVIICPYLWLYALGFSIFALFRHPFCALWGKIFNLFFRKDR